MRKAFLLMAVAILATGSLRADFSYEHISRMTGGALLDMMKMLGPFAKSAREPIHSQIVVKGNRMATYTGAEHASIIDVDKETITQIDFKRKNYSVMTFEQMKQAMEEMSRKMKEKNPQTGEQAELNFKVSVKDAGETKPINGFDAHHMILNMTMEGTDKKSGQTGGMDINSDMWLAKGVKGYDEVRALYQEMAKKMAWTPDSSMFTMMQGQANVSKGMAELYKESAKMEGFPVLQTMKMSGQGQPGEGQQASSSGSEKHQQQQAEAPSVGSVLGGLGGFGGFGKKKKKEEPKEEPAAGAGAPSPSSSGGSAPGVLLEMTIESSNFSTAPVDDSKFQVPAGFQQVESPMQKRLGK